MQDIAKDPKAFVARYQELLEDDSVAFPSHYLAQELDLDISIIRRRLVRNGITDEAGTNQRVYERQHLVGELRHLRAGGLSYPAIAAKLGFELEHFFATASYWKSSGYIDFDPREEYDAPMKIDSAVNR